jgi:hypothetical protein
MDYFAGLDISMDETHVCVLDREGVVVCESKTESTAEATGHSRLYNGVVCGDQGSCPSSTPLRRVRHRRALHSQ